MSTPQSTTLSKPGFVLHVPFVWTEHPAETGFEFRNASLPEQLLVSVHDTARELDDAERRTVVLGLLKARLGAIQALSREAATATEPDLRAGEGQFEARVIGEDGPSSVRFAFLIRATATRAVSVSLYRYTLADAGTPFDAYAGIIFDFAQVT